MATLTAGSESANVCFALLDGVEEAALCFSAPISGRAQCRWYLILGTRMYVT